MRAEYVDISPEEQAEYEAALKAGEIPETPLSKLVWLNWKRFPDCILLTQVGNFYEVGALSASEAHNSSLTFNRRSRCLPSSASN